MLLMLLTFLLTTALYVCLFWWASRRVIQNLQGNVEATKALVEALLIPLFGRKPKPDEEEREPLPAEIEGKP